MNMMNSPKKYTIFVENCIFIYEHFIKLQNKNLVIEY